MNTEKATTENGNLPIFSVSGSYFISNIDNGIHNAIDYPNKRIIDWGQWKEISILDSEGGEIDSCTLYETLNDLLEVIR